MLEALLEKFIINYLGRYFSGLDKKKIDIGVWKGDIAIENLALNHDLLTTANLPIEVVYSYIARLALKVPWTRLSSSSVELTVEDVFLLVRIKSRDEWKDQDFNNLDCKYDILKKCANNVIEKLASLAEKKPSQKSGPPGHIEKILIKIIDNLQITLKNVHIRVECADNTTFTAGFHLQNLKIMTTDESFSNLKYQKFESTSSGRVVRKLAKISSFQIYWNSKPSEYWYKTPSPESLYIKFKTFNLTEIEHYRIILLAADLRLTINEKGGSLMNKADSKYTVELDIPLLDVKLTTSQIKDLLTFLANMDNYKSKKTLSLEDVRYGIFRPVERIRDTKPGPEKQEAIKNWWMFAVRAAWHKQKVQSGKYVDHWGSPHKRKLHEHTFKTIFWKVYNKKIDPKELPKHELVLFEEIMKGYYMGTLKAWTEGIVLKEAANQQQAQKVKATDEDSFMLRRFLSSTLETDFKESEIKTLEKAILESITTDNTDIINKQIQRIKEKAPQYANENLVKFKFQVVLQKGSIYLNNNTIQSASKSTSSLVFRDELQTPEFKTNQGPSYTLVYEGMEIDVNFGTEKMDLTYKLETLCLSANLRGIDINIADVNKKKENEPFLLFYMDQPVHKGSAPLTIHLGLGAIHFIYYPFVIYEFQNLLSLDSFEEKGKNVAMRELRSIGKRSKTKVEEYMQSPPEMIIDIFIESPMVTVPFPLWRETYLAEAVSEILVLNLGTLRISNHEESTAAVEREMRRFATYSNDGDTHEIDHHHRKKIAKEFEETNISLKSINLTYYPHSFNSPVAMLNTLTKMHHTGGLRTGHPSGEGFKIIENFSLNINISKLKQKSLEDHQPEVKVSGKIYDISVNLSAKTYELLLLLAQRENDTRARVFLKEQKGRILNNSTLKGYMSYQNPKAKSWKRHYVILSGSHMYFYESDIALKPNFNLNINASKVLPPADNAKHKNSFSLMVNNAKHSFLATDKSSMTKWMNEIKQKATEFAPAFDGSFSSFDEKLVQKKKLPKVQTMISLQVERFKVTLKSHQNEDWMTLVLGNLFCLGHDSATEFDLRLSLESLDFYESHGKFPSDHLRTLIKSQDEKHLDRRLIDVQVITQKEKNPEGGNVDKLINFKFGKLAVYWKPKLILELMDYFKKPAPTHTSLASYRTGGDGSYPEQQGEFSTFSIAFGQQVNAQELIDETEEDILEDTINLIMDFSAGRITLFLEFQGLYLASLDLIDYQMNIRVKPDQLDVQGSLSQVKIHDMTQYPSTRTQHEDFAEFVREEMFTTDKNESAVKFSFLDFSKNTRMNNLNKRKKLLNLDFSSFNLIYLQQPILRLINYFLESVMGILIKDSPTRTIPEAMKTLESPSFTEMRVTINRPKIRLKPVPNFSYYYDVDLGFIVLTNTHEKVAERVIESSSVEEVWVEKYAIRFSDMVFWTTHATATQQVSEFFNLQMEVERMIFNTEYQTIYKNSKFNKEISIKGHFTPIIMGLSKLNYLLLMSMLFSNVIFDDKKEAYFTQSAKPGAAQNPTTIKVDLHFDSLDMLLLDDNNHPLLSLGLIHKSITITRDAKKEMTVKMKGDKLFGNYYLTNISKGIVNEIAYVNNAMFTKDYVIRRDGLGGPNKKKIMSIWRAYSEIFDNIKSLSKQRFSDVVEHDSNKFEMIIEMKNNNEKNIKIELSKLKCMLNFRLARIGADFFGYSEKVQVFTPIIEKGLLTVRKSIPQLNVDIKFSDCLILLSSQVDTNTIALKGKFSFMYVRNSYEESELYEKPPSRILDKEAGTQEITMNKNEDPDDVIEGDHKITSKWMFDAQPMEIIMGALNDLLQLPHARTNVTSIFLPFNIFIISENAVLNEVVNKQTNERVFLLRSLKKFNFELANVRVTYKDFMNLIKIFQYQLECYNDYSDTINSEKNAQVFPKPEKSVLKEEALSQTPFQQTEFGFQGINFVLINDVFGAHSPLLEFNIKDSEVLMLKKGTSTMTSSLSLNVNFFNPFIGRWEPIIEPLTLYIETFKGEPPSSQTTVSIESDHAQAINPVYLNISQEMITIVKRDLKLCMEEYKRLSKYNEAESLTENDEENIQEGISIPKLPASDYNRNDTSPEKRPNFFGFSVVSEKMSKIGLESDIYSPYAILNRIGQSCFVEPEFEDDDDDPNPTLQTYHCVNGRVCGIDLEDKSHVVSTKYGKGNEFRQLSQKVRIEIPLRQNYSFIINNVELNQVSQKKYKLSYKNPTTKSEEQFELLSYVELVGTKRILTLSSINKIVNCTSFQINVKVKHEEKAIEEMIDRGGEYFIPFTFNTFGLSLQVDNQEWPPFVMNDQLNRPDIAQQFKLGNRYFVIRRDFSIKQMNVFVIEPPFIIRNFLPAPLMLDLYDGSIPQGPNNKPQIVTLAENDAYQAYDFKFDCPLTATVRIDSFVPSEGVLLNVKNKNTDNKITLKDFAKQTCLLNLYSTGEPNGCKTLHIYTDLYIKNQTPYNLIFEYKGDGQVTKFARQNLNKTEKMRDDLNNKIIFGQTEKKYQRIYISLRDDPTIKTKKISIQSIGGNSVSAENKETFLHSSGAAEAEGKLASYDFGIEINMVNHLKSLNDERKYFLYSKVITVYPRYVIVNKTTYSLSLIQPETMYSSPFIVKPNERTHFYWKSSKLDKFVRVLLVDPSNKTEILDWKWSGSLDLATIGDQHFLCVKIKGNEVKFLKATTIIEKSVLYTVIEEQNDADNLGYRIVNDSSDCTITVQQDLTESSKDKHVSNYKIVVPENQQKGFSWQEPLLKKEIKCEVKFKSSQYETLTIKCEPDKKVNTVQNYPLRSNGRNLNTKITLKVFMDGNTKVIRFAPFTRQEEEQPKTEIEKFSLTMKIGVIGLSIISTIDNIRKEVIFAGVKDLEFAWLESNENRTFHMRVKHLQIDNNSSSHAQYPVLLTPYNKIMAGKPESENYFIDGLITFSLKDKKSIILPQVKLELSKPVLRIEDSFIDAILKLTKSFQTDMMKTMNTVKYSTVSIRNSVASPLRHFGRSSTGAIVLYDWQVFNVETNTRSIYVEDFGLSYIEVLFSFKMNYDPFEKSDFSVTKLVSNALGVAITNIENAPIRLKGLEITGVLDSPKRFIEKLGKHYKQELIKSVFTLLGSVEILGNPIGLFNHITTGMIDFIEKPREGFIRGPLEGGMGIVKGTHSLFRNTILGTFGTVNKITGSVAAGISTLSLDQEFIKRREGLRKKKANDVVDGLGQGLYALYDGINQGVVGLFTKPFEEASRSGFTGFLKGSYMGISGVIVKPVIGLLDAASKTAEGFKSMAETNDEGILSTKQRIPRPFYGKQMMFRNYIPYDAEILFILTQLPDTEVNITKYCYIDAYPMRPSKENTYVLNLVIFSEAIGLFSLKMNKFVWIAEYDWIERVELNNIFITFTFRKDLPKTTISTYTVINANLKVNELIMEQIRDLIKKS